MHATRQLDFFTPRSSRQLQEHARRVEHGGEIRKGKRKLARPFDRRRPMHLTLRSTLARGEWSMLRVKKAEAIHRLAYRLARENDVRIYQYANSGNHLHLLLRARTRKGFQRFLRTFSALIPRIVTGAKKGNPIIAAPAARAGSPGISVSAASTTTAAQATGSGQSPRKFWDALAWTMIVSWGRQFFNGRYYVIRNELEAEGWLPCHPRKTARNNSAVGGIRNGVRLRP